jgi:hypothetical protein
MAETDTILRRLAVDNATLPDVRKLLSGLMVKFGGLEGYLRLVSEDVLASPEGSSQRMTFHNNYLSAIAKFGGNEDLESMGLESALEEAKILLEAEKKDTDTEPEDDDGEDA